jgi:hypothetical protein
MQRTIISNTWPKIQMVTVVWGALALAALRVYRLADINLFAHGVLPLTQARVFSTAQKRAGLM